MRNHLDPGGRSGTGTKLVGVRELKTHAARILRRVREERASYVLTHRGRVVAVLLPVETSDQSAASSNDANARVAWETFLRAGRRLERRFRTDVSGVQVLSAMRR